MIRPYTTLFALMSADGKISTGSDLEHDFDKDLPMLNATANGLPAYYQLEKETDDWTLSSGVTQQKMFTLYGDKPLGEEIPVTMVVVDTGHLTADAIRWLKLKYRHVVMAVRGEANHSNHQHNRIWYTGGLQSLLQSLFTIYGCRRLTIQTGSTLTQALLQEGCIDCVRLIVAPLLVGGAGTPSLVGGTLPHLTGLKLHGCRMLGHNYIELTYTVL